MHLSFMRFFSHFDIGPLVFLQHHLEEHPLEEEIVEEDI
jgi:hypothetical protein